MGFVMAICLVYKMEIIEFQFGGGGAMTLKENVGDMFCTRYCTGHVMTKC